jgi:hypothetical protein
VCSYEPVSISNKIRPGKMGKIIRAEIPSTVECRMPLRCLVKGARQWTGEEQLPLPCNPAMTMMSFICSFPEQQCPNDIYRYVVTPFGDPKKKWVGEEWAKGRRGMGLLRPSIFHLKNFTSKITEEWETSAICFWFLIFVL